jgi:HEAT repeat protein
MFKTTGDRQAAIAAIRQFATNAPASFPELSALLKTGDPDLAMLGAQGLASLGSKEAAAELISAVQNAQPGATKRQLSAALASLSNPDAANLFLGLMGSPQDRELAAAAQSALGNSANAAVLQEIVQRYQASSAADERDGLVAALRYSQSPQCVDALLAILNAQKVVSATEPLGLAAADTLGIIGTTNAVSPLFAYLGNLRPGDTSPVYDSIGRISNPEALPLITSIAYGQVPGSTLYSRMAAVQALGNYSSHLVSPALTWLAQNDPNAGIKDAAGAALQRTAAR